MKTAFFSVALRIRILFFVILVATILAVGCYSYAGPLALAASRAKTGDTERFVAVYERPATDETAEVAKLWQDRLLLEDFVGAMNEFVRIPRTVKVVGKECDDPNASYSIKTHMIEMCYELALEEQRLFESNGYTAEEAREKAYESILGSLYHELGHALIGELDLKFTGREEDVADQMTAYFFTRDDDLKDLLLTVADSYAIAAADIDYGELSFYDTHSLDAQRSTNFLCYIYGSDPSKFKDIIKEEYLPEYRAEGCEEEYSKMIEAWDALLNPHLRHPSEHAGFFALVGFRYLLNAIEEFFRNEPS